MVTGTKFSQIPLSSTNPVATSTFVAFDSANPSSDVRYTLAEMKNVFPTIFANNVKLYIRTPPVVCTISSANPCQVQTLAGTAGQPGGSPVAHGLAINDQVALSILRTWFTCSVDTSGTNLFTASAAHNFNVNDPVQLIADISGGSYATGFSTNTTYFVIASGLDATHFRLSATVGGASLTIGGTQTGQLYYYRTGTIPAHIIEGYSGYFVVGIPSPSTFTFSTTLGGSPVSTLGSAQAGYFVVQTGNNNNDGLSATYGHALMDIQRFADLVSDSFLNGGTGFSFPVQANVSPGTYFEAVGLGSIQGSGGPDTFGASALIVATDDTHPENYRVDGGGSPAFRAVAASNWFIDGFYLLSSFGGTIGSSGLINSQFNSIIQASAIYWGSNQSAFAAACTNDDNCTGRLFLIGTHKVVDFQQHGFVKCDKDSFVEMSHGDFFMMVPQTWDVGFAEIARGAFLFLRSDDMNWHNCGNLLFSGDTLYIQGYGKGVSTGALTIHPGDGKAHFIDQTGWFFDQTRSWTVGAPSYTFAHLPTLPVEGMVYTVSDANVATGPITAGSGTNHVLAVYLASTNQWYALSISSAGTPGGSNTQVQYNNGGAFGGITNFTSTGGNANITSGGVLLYNNMQVLQAQPSLNNFYDGGSGNLTATGTNNTATGNSALLNLTTGGSNAAVGTNALLNATTANQCMCIGTNAGKAIVSSLNCLYVGAGAGQFGGGNANAAFGGLAMQNATINNGCTAIGSSAMGSGDGAVNSIAIGTSSMAHFTGNGISTCIGNISLLGMTAGTVAGNDNLALGRSCLDSLANGSNNIAMGISTLALCTTGQSMIGIGGLALGAATTDVGHIGVGVQAGTAINGAPNDNVMIGRQSGLNLVTGDSNTFVGAKFSGGAGVGNVVTSGRANVILGAHAGHTAGMSNCILFSDGDQNLRMEYNGGWLIGAAGGGGQGAGTLNVQNNIYMSGSAYTNPAWVFDHHYDGVCKAEGEHVPPAPYAGLPSIEICKEFTKEHRELPCMAMLEHRGLRDGGDLLLAALEQAYLYIFQLEERITKLEQEKK